MKNLDTLIKQIKEYETLESEIREIKEQLKNEAIEILSANHIDEYSCTIGKITYRQVLSNRFASSEFKKLHSDLYNSFIRTTTCMRFNLN